MNLFICRHASAGTSRSNPVLDAKRPLDKDGKRHCLQLAHILNSLKINFDIIVSSPLKRSLQTATLLATETGFEAPVRLSTGLAPEARFAEFQQLIAECKDRENVLLVGHNPNLQSFLGSLLVPPSARTGAQTGTPVEARTRLRKGSVARLNLTRGPASLQWLIDPRMVRALYMTSTAKPRRKAPRPKGKSTRK